MYRIKNQAIDLDVTLNHRMYVSTRDSYKYQIEKAEDIFDIIPSFINSVEKLLTKLELQNASR